MHLLAAFAYFVSLVVYLEKRANGSKVRLIDNRSLLTNKRITMAHTRTSLPALFFAFAVAAVMTTGYGCKKADDGKEISYTYNFEIPAGTPASYTTYINLRDLNTNSKAWLAQQGLKASDIKSVNVKSVQLAMTSGSEKFGSMEKVFLHILNTAKPSPIEISFNFNIPTEQDRYLDLAPDLTEIRDYFLQDLMTLQLRLIPRATTQTTAEARIDVKWVVYLN